MCDTQVSRLVVCCTCTLCIHSFTYSVTVIRNLHPEALRQDGGVLMCFDKSISVVAASQLPCASKSRATGTTGVRRQEQTVQSGGEQMLAGVDAAYQETRAGRQVQQQAWAEGRGRYHHTPTRHALLRAGHLPRSDHEPPRLSFPHDCGQDD